MMVIFNVGSVLKFSSNTHQVSKLITMNIKNNNNNLNTWSRYRIANIF
jgi:hypothetical protein